MPKPVALGAELALGSRVAFNRGWAAVDHQRFREVHLMRSLGWLFLAVVALGMPSDLWAQERGRDDDDDDWRERRVERRGDDDDDDDDDSRFERRRRDDDFDRRIRVRERRRDDGFDWRRARVRDRDIDRRSRGRGRWDIDDDVIVLRDERGRIFVVDRREFERLIRVERGRGHGPAFCRDGRGHPVYGRRWCLEKGFGLGVRRDVFDDRGRTIFRQGDQVVIGRRDSRNRGTIDRIVEKILLGGD